jgi:hypothetical protein
MTAKLEVACDHDGATHGLIHVSENVKRRFHLPNWLFSSSPLPKKKKKRRIINLECSVALK